MSTLDEILDKSMYKQDFWTKEVKREISDIEAKQQIKALMLELVDEAQAHNVTETGMAKELTEMINNL